MANYIDRRMVGTEESDVMPLKVTGAESNELRPQRWQVGHGPRSVAQLM